MRLLGPYLLFVCSSKFGVFSGRIPVILYCSFSSSLVSAFVDGLPSSRFKYSSSKLLSLILVGRSCYFYSCCYSSCYMLSLIFSSSCHWCGGGWFLIELFCYTPAMEGSIILVIIGVVIIIIGVGVVTIQVLLWVFIVKLSAEFIVWFLYNISAVSSYEGDFGCWLAVVSQCENMIDNFIGHLEFGIEVVINTYSGD